MEGEEGERTHGDGAGDGGLLVLVGDALSGNGRAAAVGELDDHGGVDVLRRRECARGKEAV